MKALKSFLLISFLLFIPFLGKTQNVGIGADAMYNLETEGFGAGLRATFLLNPQFSLSPEFSYYPGFDKVNEYYLGAAIEDKFFRIKNYSFYALGYASYDNWLNYEVSPMKKAQENNWDLEGGFGVTTNKCLRPFLEYRYNVRFEEAHFRIGLLYIIGCGSEPKMKKESDNCPRF
ncbi:MAG: hypothetical protein ACLQQ4_09730 [Bacteroidia bacterium]